MDSMTQKVVLAVNTSAAASTPVYLAMTGAKADRIELSLSGRLGKPDRFHW
jgi:hypothetical protein